MNELILLTLAGEARTAGRFFFFDFIGGSEHHGALVSGDVVSGDGKFWGKTCAGCGGVCARAC